MAAVRPIVLVYQDFATVSVPVSLPDLNVTVVGPAFRIFDYATEKASILVGTAGSKTLVAAGTTAVTQATLAATNVAAWTLGDLLDESSVVNFVDEGFAELVYGNDGTCTTNANTLGSVASNFVTAGVAVGDRVVVTGFDSGSPTRTLAKTVQAVAANSLTLTTNFAATGVDITGAAYTGITPALTALKFRVERPISGVRVNEAAVLTNVSTSQTPQVAVANMNVNVGGVAKRLSYGKIYTAFRALRTDLGAVLTDIRALADITTSIGKLDERNPLAVGAYLALQNAGKKVTALGINNYNLNTSTTGEALGHTNAIDTLRGRRDVYAVVPLTSDTAIIGAWKANAVTLADPAIAKFRVIIGSTTLPLSKSVYAPGTATGNPQASAGNPPQFNFFDNGASFVTVGVAVGDTVTIAATGYSVVAVNSENSLTLSGTHAGAADQTYSITRTFGKAQQVEELVAVAKGLKSKRCVMVWPGECAVSGVANAATGIASHQPGYYVAAAVGGMVAGLPPQQGFTYLGMVGIDELFKSNTYFYDDQLDALMTDGWYVVVQDSPNSAPYCLREVTTDTDTLESTELMIVKTFDYVSTAYRNALVGFLGRYNVIPETLSMLRSAFDSVTDTLKQHRYPRIGGVILDATIDKIEVSPGSKDQVDVYGAVTLPRPLNRIRLFLSA
jgi:hypothetical protein